jgi:hypothetical protein
MTQRELSLTQLTATRASDAVVLIRFYVGLIFVGAGGYSYDARMIRAGSPARVTSAAV